jgi:hypothetical protein
MKQQEVFKKIGVIIKELNEQYDYLVASQSDLNDLELELFVANAHFLTDNAQVLRKLTQQSPQVPKPAPAAEEKYFEPVVQKLQTQAEVQPLVSLGNSDKNPVPNLDLRGDDTGADFSLTGHDETATIRHELTLDDIPNWEREEEEILADDFPAIEEKEEAIEKPATYAQRAPERPVIQNSFIEPMLESSKEEPITINQRISALLNNSGSRMTEQLSTQPIADLKQAITLNDKLLYIKDLFNGYNLAYNEAIDILNRLSTFDQADAFLRVNYSIKHNWEAKQATAEKFYDLLKRRYA